MDQDTGFPLLKKPSYLIACKMPVPALLLVSCEFTAYADET